MACINSRDREPLRMMIQGLPGAGKSQVMHWIRAFFAEVLRWTPGNEYVCIASMNSRAALIGGSTIHSFGHIPISKKAQDAKKVSQWSKPDMNPMFVSCQNLRWVLVDETSSASAEILGSLDANLRSAIRKENTYARRRRGDTATEPRPFGGLNMLFFTDWWQLPPVLQTSLFTNPYRSYSPHVQRILNMFWSKETDALTKMRELRQCHRCQDPFLSAFLQQCRKGSLTWTMYNFFAWLSDTCYRVLVTPKQYRRRSWSPLL